jgi:hypothetical protein
MSALIDRGEQDRMGTDFQQRVTPVRQDPLHDCREEHRLAQVPSPIPGPELHSVADFRRDGRMERNRGKPGPERREPLLQLVEQRIHLRAVRRNVDVHAAAEDLLALKRVHDRVERGGVARQHRGRRAALDGNRHLVAERGSRADRRVER